MQETIDFKAWDTQDNRMIDVLLWSMDSGVMPVNGNWDDCVTISDFDRFIWRQFTGLKLEGKRVYDGDIVSKNSINWEVFWSDKKFGWCCRARHAYGNKTPHRIYRQLHILAKEGCKVIGNRFENPELSQHDY